MSQENPCLCHACINRIDTIERKKHAQKPFFPGKALHLADIARKAYLCKIECSAAWILSPRRDWTNKGKKKSLFIACSLRQDYINIRQKDPSTGTQKNQIRSTSECVKVDIDLAALIASKGFGLDLNITPIPKKPYQDIYFSDEGV
jgi:hypothetical protein